MKRRHNRLPNANGTRTKPKSEVGVQVYKSILVTEAEIKNFDDKYKKKISDRRNRSQTQTLEKQGNLRKTSILEKPEFLNHTQTQEKSEYLNHIQTLEKPEYLNHTQTLEKPEYLNHTQTLEKPEYLNHTQILEKPDYLNKTSTLEKPGFLRRLWEKGLNKITDSSEPSLTVNSSRENLEMERINLSLI
ncbi:uncharacterized protein LOC111718436 [Eurytemora carolleeae]|uniref:uncharacterized protein LOC111718436 n=1 Tax=Eurytemora carolleeae TaxID=1294199 RepID=UPI000C779FA2|nr:uncharacterized protein LOC111718436 [Eurytemora carolleeae]|eukprot:XP_023349793.1 uncharacterized protein LOC111718436 [Eurytemora affinis]